MRLAFGGDVSLHHDVSEDVFGCLAPALTCPLVVCYEAVLAAAGEHWTAQRDKVVLASPVERWPWLEALDVAAVCLANNHLLDFGPELARRTIERSARRYPTFGAGLEPSSFHRHVVEREGTRVGLVAYCRPDTAPLYATSTSVGPRDYTPQQWAADQAWSGCHTDHLVVLLHWGDVHTHVPRPDQVAFARRLIDDGADAVVGCHSHTVQGHEVYRAKPIFYSLGNLCFPDVRAVVGDRVIIKPNLRRNRWGLLVELAFRAGRAVTVERLVPIADTHRQPRPAVGSGWARRIDRYSRWATSPQLPQLWERIRAQERRWKGFEERVLRWNARLLRREVPGERPLGIGAA